MLSCSKPWSISSRTSHIGRSCRKDSARRGRYEASVRGRAPLKIVLPDFSLLRWGFVKRLNRKEIDPFMMWKFLRCISKYLSEGVIKVFMTVLYRALSARANKIETKRIISFPPKLPTVQNSWTMWQNNDFLTKTVPDSVHDGKDEMKTVADVQRDQDVVEAVPHFLSVKRKSQILSFLKIIKDEDSSFRGGTLDAIDAALSFSPSCAPWIWLFRREKKQHSGNLATQLWQYHKS